MHPLSNIDGCGRTRRTCSKCGPAYCFEFMISQTNERGYHALGISIYTFLIKHKIDPKMSFINCLKNVMMH